MFVSRKCTLTWYEKEAHKCCWCRRHSRCRLEVLTGIFFCEVSITVLPSSCHLHVYMFSSFILHVIHCTQSRAARAIETQCYVLAAAQYGRHNSKRESYGHSLAVDPWGRVVADAGGSDGSGTAEEQEPPSIILCDIEVDEMESVRERMPIQQHRDAASFTF